MVKSKQEIIDEQRDAISKLKLQILDLQPKYNKAYNEGLSAFAWWKDGVQYVGTCGTTLKSALREEV